MLFGTAILIFLEINFPESPDIWLLPIKILIQVLVFLLFSGLISLAVLEHRTNSIAIELKEQASNFVQKLQEKN